MFTNIDYGTKLEQTQYLEYLLENFIYLIPSYLMTTRSISSRSSEVRCDAGYSIERELGLCQERLISSNFHVRHG